MLQLALGNFCNILSSELSDMDREQTMGDGRELIARIVAGEARAFEEFVRQYQRLVSHIVFRMIDNVHDREDICQEVFLAIYEHLPTFRWDAKLSTWVARITYNRCLTHLEKMKVPVWSDFPGEEQSFDNISGDGKTPEECLEEQDLTVRLHEEIGRLPAMFRTIVTLYHLDEMSYHEIGEIMGLPEGTVKSYLFRARKLLRERLLSKYRLEEIWR